MIYKQILILLLNGMAFFGIALIVYGYISHFMDQEWPPLDATAQVLSYIFTLIGTVLVALSVYMPGHTRSADTHSKYFTAPVIILLVVIVCTLWFLEKECPPRHVVNGFAVLAIAGALLRALPFSEWDKRTW